MKEESSHTNPSTKPSVGGRPGMVVVLLLIAVVAVIGVLIIHNHNQKKSSSTANTPAPAVVSITATGFVPANINVAVGTTIKWTNADTKPHSVASDPYPTDNGLPGFNSATALQHNDSYSYTFSKSGVFGYHDNQDPTAFKGTVVVQEPK